MAVDKPGQPALAYKIFSIKHSLLSV